MALFLPTYFAPITQYAAILKSDNVVFEVQDNYQKQTYRNRCYIYGANGKQLLNIPVKHLKSNTKKATRDTLVENDFNWQGQHFKSLKSAYRSSPFFEFFEHDLAKIFNTKYKYLLDVNIDTHLFITDALEISSKFSKTSEYEVSIDNDYRSLANSKVVHPFEIPKYIQVFDDKFGFLENLSILDLLFMEGGNSYATLTYVK